jgi:O-antigen/teichoic acid export membrane protein
VHLPMPLAVQHSPSLFKFHLQRTRRTLFGSRLRRNMVRSVGLAAVAALVAAVSYPLYLHLLGYKTYGLWLVLSSVITFSQLGNLGISQAVAKYIAEEHGRGNPVAIREYVSTACAMIIVSGSALVMLVIALRRPIIILLGLKGSDAILAGSILPLIAMLSVYVFLTDLSNNTLNGLGRIDLCNACSVGTQFLTIIIAIPLLLHSASVWALLIASIAANAVFHLFSNYLAYRIGRTPLYSFKAVKITRAKGLLSFGGWMLASSMVGMLVNPVNRTLLSRYGGLALVPIYDIALNASGRIRSLIEVSHKALSTEVSRLSAQKGTAASAHIQALIRKSLKPVALAGVPVVIAIIFMQFPLKLWLGTRFVPELTTTVRIALAASYVSLFATPSYYVLIGRGQACDIFWHFLILCSVNVLLVGIFICSFSRLTATLAIEANAAAVVTAAVFLLWRQKATAPALQAELAGFP